MKLWIRARWDGPAVALVSAGTITVPLWGSTDMPVVRLGFGPAPFVILLPALAAAGIISLTHQGLPAFEALSPRPTGALSRLLVCALLGLISSVWLISGIMISPGEIALAASRNLAGYLGIALITSRLLGSVVGSASPLIYAIVVAVLGSSSAGAWSWPLHPAASRPAMVTVGALFIVGLAVGAGREVLRTNGLRDE